MSANDFVTRDEFNRLEGKVDKIDSKVDRVNDSVIRLEEGLKNIPKTIIAELPPILYANCTRISIVEKALDKLESNQRWLIRTIGTTIIGAVLSLILIKA